MRERTFSHKRYATIVAILLIAVITFITVFMSVDADNVYASTAGSNMIDGIDYSGQGTKIDGEIEGQASVDGDYVNIPVELNRENTLQHGGR
jgi:hypothetical protein